MWICELIENILDFKGSTGKLTSFEHFAFNELHVATEIVRKKQFDSREHKEKYYKIQN